MNKTLLIYWSFGVSLRDRMKNSLRNFTSLQYFDVLVLTDNVEHFDDLDYPNLVVKDVKQYMDLYPEHSSYELLPSNTNDYPEFVASLRELRRNGVRFPCNLQRYGLLYEKIQDYENVAILDCDMLPVHTLEEVEEFEEYYRNNVDLDSICSHYSLYYWNTEEHLTYLEKYAKELGKDIDINYPIVGFDSLFKIYRFGSPEKIKEFFDVWHHVVLDTYKEKSTLLTGSWNILPEAVLGVVYKLAGIKVNIGDDYSRSLYRFVNFTYPEDRFWDDVCFANSYTEANTREEAIEKNYEIYMNFYKRNHHDRRFKNEFFPYAKVYITLTTIPSRLAFESDTGIKRCINSLLDQDTIHDYEIHFNIPKINKKTGVEYVVPEWLINLSNENPKLKLFTDLEDMGTLTKTYYTLRRIENPEDIMIVCDDDLIYHPKLVDEQVRNQYIYKNYSVGYDGVRAEAPAYNDVRDHYVVSIDRNVEVNYLQHYKTVSYKRKYFDEDFFTEFINYSWNDDLILGAYMTKRNIKKMVTFYRFEEPIKSLEEWSNRGGVLTFPCLGHTHHEHYEGCNLYRHEQISDNGDLLRQLKYLK